jgi:hypothetical protein
MTKQEENVSKEKSLEKTSLHKSGKGFNLIAPQLEKVEKETKEKFRVDIRVVLFVFFVVLVSLGIAGYNWYVTMNLEKEKEELVELKESLKDYEYTIQANNQILERYTLYGSIREGFISSKEVLNFWQEVSDNLGEIRNIELSDGVNFEVSGRAGSLRDVTRLWHFLSIDDRVKSVTLEGVSIPSERGKELNFSFKGVLNLEYFNKRK